MFVQPLDIRAVVTLLEALDGTQEDLEMVLLIEQVIYEKING